MKSLSLSQPHVIIMVGIPGSGKSFFATKFAETFHAPLVSADNITSLASSDQAATQLVRLQIDELLKTGKSIIVEVGGDTRHERTEYAKYFRSSGYAPLFVWVQTDPETAYQRAAKTKRMDADAFNSSLKHFSPPHQSEKVVVISGKHTYASQAKIVLKRLSSPRADISSHKQPPARGTIVVR